MSAQHVRSLTAAQQYHLLRTCPVSGGQGVLRAGELVWTCDVHPTLLSRTYTVRIVYRQGRAPSAFVLEPDLNELAAGRPLPHVYGERPPELCLYLPRACEWAPSMRLADTIVPWINLWLFYFEEWLLSNEWKGGGEHPKERNEPGQKITRDRRRRH